MTPPKEKEARFVPKVKNALDQQATVAVLSQIREEARINRRELSRKMGYRENFVSLVEQSERVVAVPELRTYALACERDPLEVYARILQETALYTTQQQASATARLAARRISVASKKKAATKKKRK